MGSPQPLPNHLKRYVVDQDYSRYTPVDQEVWRTIMRQLQSYLGVHAHPCYLEGLTKTGIETDRIPDVRKVSEQLSKFGWRAVSVSGFIPPAAFMELQAHGYLPVASDMRTTDHLLYTPAPDIVHEAAGHAPILIDPEFAAYLKAYAQVAAQAIISAEDMDQYEAIRALSDLKENPDSTTAEIAAAESELTRVSKAITDLSEAALLGRMNWWTAEYGLIGSLEAPRIYGAGLLSSLGESRSCLSSAVKKIPLTLDCINYGYDITEKQPQLFVTPNFHHLTVVLDELAAQMAYRQGGSRGLQKARKARTVTTTVLNSRLQISGVLSGFEGDDAPTYLQLTGPTQLCLDGSEISGHGVAHHAQGFGSPLGLLSGQTKCLSLFSDPELQVLGIRRGEVATLRYQSGITVHGTVIGTHRAPSGALVLISFKDCNVAGLGKRFFEPAWGVFDMAVGSTVTSVFGGPADRGHFGETSDFAAKVLPRKVYDDRQRHQHRLYEAVQQLRERTPRLVSDVHSADMPVTDAKPADLAADLAKDIQSTQPGDWLIRLSLLEIGARLPKAAWQAEILKDLHDVAARKPDFASVIQDGLYLIEASLPA